MESGWEFSKRLVTATHGIVAAKHPLAARVGLEVLRRGGNAVDAAVATAFAVGVVEPWMSGLGGGGVLVMVPGHGSDRRPVAVDFGVRAPAAAHAGMYVLEDSYDEELFGWRAVRGQANIHGPLSVAVPGVPAGLSLSLARLGTMPLADVLRPAITLARDGFPIDWTTTLEIALDAATIRMYPETAALFLPDGGPVVPSDTPRPRLLRQPALARTLEAMAEGGPEVFYRGPVGRQIADGVRQGGGILTADDLAGYESKEYPAYVSVAREREIAVPPGATGGVTLVEMLNILEGAPLRTLGHNTVEYLHLIIEATRAAFADRLSLLAEGVGADVVTSPEHAAARRRQLSPTAAAGRTSGRDPTSTTHLCVVDATGTAVSLTQTLLSRFGSRVVIPETGVLLNNGMMWFNPEPGHANSVGPNRRPLANMTPAIVMDGGRPVLAVGASGGRRIIDAVLQIILNIVEFGMDVQAALAAPRVDASTPQAVVDARISQDVQDGLRKRGHVVVAAGAAVSPHFFASPVAISRDSETGLLTGGADPYHPAIAAGY
jgi:gamma-glutamyltranspeptidase / glutathione hydrolase